MNPITPMEAYATTDGRLHTDPLEAQAHQYGLDIKKEVSDFFNHDGRSSYFDTYTVTRMMAVIDWEVSRKLKQLKEQNV